MRFWWRVWPAAVVVLLWGCGGTKQPTEDPTTTAMKQAVAKSAARVTVVGRTDWDVTPSKEEFWVRIRLHNSGGAGEVALRAALRTQVPYVGIGASPTEPQYFQMEADETKDLRFTGKVPAGLADRALGVVTEVYPNVGNAEQPTPTG